ncbi:hypothetical protein EJB05_11431, partial [Eragrostis curvula]
MEISSKTSRVCCVTGAAGFIGSWLVKKLLDRGCVVHATVRDLGHEKKVGLLRALPGAAERLLLFEADLYDAATFEPAIAGCEFVFLVAAPMDAIEAVVNATRTILEQCERSKTVRRVIYTGSLVAASPLMEDGGGSFKHYVDESCWTPLNLSYGYSSEGLNGYVTGKTLCEKLLINSDGAAQQSRAFEMVTLLCGLVGGDTLLPFLNGSLQVMVSPLTGAEAAHNNLKFLQALLGSVPLVHVDDVCDAHVFCMEMPTIAGRFLCSAAWTNMQDIVGHHARKHPESLNPAVSEVEGEGVRVQAGTSKLVDLGFRFRYGAEEVLDGAVEWDEKKVGLLRALPGAAERLLLFEADLYDAATFEPTISGCEFVFLVAAPMVRHCSGGRSKDATEAVVNATRTILQQCDRSKTVRRVIYTGSFVAASPLKEDGTGFKDSVDESCWTPLNLSHGYSNESLDGYVTAKTLCEKEVLNYNSNGDSPQSRAFEVVTLLLGLVGGDTLLPFLHGSLQAIVWPLTGAEAAHNALKFLQALQGAVPLVHVDDVCEAHVFCMERPSIVGRFLCAAAWPNMQDIVGHHARKYPERLNPAVKEVAGEGVRVQAGTSKLVDLGFKYRYGAEEVLDGSVECAKRLGVL